MKTQYVEHIGLKKVTHLDYVRGLLVMNRISPSKIAENIGVTVSAVSHVLSGRAKSRRVMKAVADALNIPFAELWGDKVIFIRKLRLPQ